MRSRERGSSLLLVVVVCTIALAIIMMALTEQQVAVKYTGVSQRQLQVQYAAEAGLFYVCDQIGHPANAYTGPQVGSVTTVIPGNGYNGSTNLWLQLVRDNTVGNWKPFFPTSATAPTGATFYLHASTLDKNGNPTPSATTPVPPDSRYINMPDIPVYVWLQDSGVVQGNDYRVVAYAEYPQKVNEAMAQWNGVGPAPTWVSPDDRVQVAVDLRESVGFSTFMFCSFSNKNLNLGALNVQGSVHSNGPITFTSTIASGGGTFVNNGNITSNGNMTNTGGGPPAPPNTNYEQVTGGFVKKNVPKILIPSNSQVTDEAATAALSGPPASASPSAAGVANFYNIVKGSVTQSTGPAAPGGAPWQGLASSSGVPINVDVTIRAPAVPGGPYKMDITATGDLGSKTYTNVDFPANGVVYTNGDITVRSADGTFAGNMTMVSGANNIKIDSNLEYVDSSGRTADILADATAYAAGTTTPRSPTGPSTQWFNPSPTGEGLAYVPNPAYTGTSALGLLAMNDVFVTNTAGTITAGQKGNGQGPNGTGNLFLNADTYAEKGSGLDAYTLNAPTTATGIDPPRLNSGQNAGAPSVKNNLAVSGSLVGNNPVIRHALGSTGGTDFGFPKSGGYGFDVKGAQSPPPGWLANQSPAYGATYKVSVYNPLFPARWMRRTGATTYANTGTLYNGFGGS